MDHAARIALFKEADLYVVITEQFCAGRRALDVLDAVLSAGVRLIQVREKDFDDGEMYRRCVEIRERTRTSRALLIVDDRLDIALAADADGVHLGLTDLPVAAARRIAPDLIVGASTHSLDEALAAQEAGASYVNIGPIFPTRTKSVPTGAVGPEMIETIAPHLRIPFTCMGGIKAENMHEVLRRGARHVAVVTAVTAAPDVRAAALELRHAMARRESRET
jgi:thiamine-phosphate pyrophosphorylase